MNENKASPSTPTNDLDAATWAYARDIPLLAHTSNGRRTTFVFQCDAETLARFYGPEGASARQLFLARRTLMGLIHGDGR